MKIVLTILFLFSTAYGQLNLRALGAVGNGIADDYFAFQAAVDSCIKTGQRLYVPPGRYKTSQTIIAARWSQVSNAYAFCTIQIYGDDVMWSSGTGISVVLPTFKDGPAFAFHLNKGSKLTGIFFDGKYRSPNISLDSVYRSDIDRYGDSTCRDSRYSPYCAVVIDPFRYNLPPDSGYPRLRQWYRGTSAVSGSTGIRIEDCTFRNFTIGLIVCPNGYTLNGEILTFENIRVNDCKFAFVGCHAQEKQNRLINWGVWGRVRCAFVWGKYGAAQPGHYNISGANVAGQVVQLVHRFSGGFFPLYIDNVFAENLGSIGYWSTSVGDVLSNSTINFYSYKNLKAFPDNHVNGNGVSYYNVNARYYGLFKIPILFKGTNKYTNTQADNYAKLIKGWRYYPTDPDYNNGYEIKRISYGILPTYYENGIKKVRLFMKLDSVAVGDVMVFYQGTNLDYSGMGEVESVGMKDYVISYISPGVTNNFNYNVGKYISK